MKILAIESSTVTASCAVAEDDNILGEYSLRHKKTHSEKLMPLIEDLMEELGLKIKDIDIIGISEGPGSYTGLRIGAALAKSLAFAANIKIVNVPTMMSLAANIYDSEKLIVPIMDAKSERIYTGIYKWENGNIVEVLEQFACNINDLIEILNDYKQPIIFNGDGSVNYRDIITSKLERSIYFAPEVFNYLKASSLSYLSYKMSTEGKGILAKDFKPQYLRMSQAERNRK